MAKFLIDVNLPYYFALWNTSDYIHQMDINDESSDEEIWEYARQNNLIIITKDSDFSNLILFRTPPPKVIHIRIGNMKIQDFFKLMTQIWPDVLELIENHKMVNVFKDRIEAIT